ncbi:XRE family transcriptional regulator [Microbacterium sp. Gd 4-13]|uniref:helix-turn-helix domain-containing protein n=1 Tax=Microbacterium sp. Gd 4-13 TaxID=2173179 RepID=UPI000D56B3DB|nr:XRE family transcriptional regulator [Microbacterium sp. Gd 4-13]PVW04771.1 XRE family transcriptional regulator [Microbacterium sp. Gd 4-13]
MRLPHAADHALLRLAREDASLTLADLAARIGVPVASLHDFEAGTVSPATGELERLFAAVDMRPSIPLAHFARELRELAAAHGLSNVRVFGSIARGDDHADSDVNLLVTGDTSSTRQFFTAIAFPAAASDLLGFPVHVVFNDSVGPAMDDIRASAVEL